MKIPVFKIKVFQVEKNASGIVTDSKEYSQYTCWKLINGVRTPTGVPFIVGTLNWFAKIGASLLNKENTLSPFDISTGDYIAGAFPCSLLNFGGKTFRVVKNTDRYADWPYYWAKLEEYIKE